jgi:hypothetical protein
MSETVPEAGSASVESVLRDLGTFRIWMNLIFGPVLIVVCIAVAAIVWQQRRGWKTVTAQVINTPDCSFCAQNQCSENDNFHCVNVQTSHTNDAGEQITWTSTEEAKRRLQKGDEVELCYDPKQTNSYLGGACMSSGARAAAVGGALFVAFMCAAFWVLNLLLRKNPNWQNVSGVLEGTSLLGSAFGWH